MCGYDNIALVFPLFIVVNRHRLIGYSLIHKYCDSLSCCVVSCRVVSMVHNFEQIFNSLSKCNMHLYRSLYVHIWISHGIYMNLVWLASRLMAVWFLNVSFFYFLLLLLLYNIHLCRIFVDGPTFIVIVGLCEYEIEMNRNWKRKKKQQQKQNQQNKEMYVISFSVYRNEPK